MIKACWTDKVILIICMYFIHVTVTASLGDICSTDTDCSFIVNSRCKRMYDCVNGTCACKTGYGNSNGDGCQKRLRTYGQSCGTSDYCNGVNQECSSGRCKCVTWYEYSSLAGECSLMTYRLLTQVCGTWWNFECLSTITDTGGQCVNDRCSCKDGYIADYSESYTSCRPPRWGERCLWNPRCIEAFDTSTVSDDTSSIAPTCSYNKCTCPPSHEHQVVNGYNLCLNKVNDGFVRYDNNEACTHFTECKSYFCVKCPGVTTGVCMAQVEIVTNTTESGAQSRHISFPILWGIAPVTVLALFVVS